MSFPRYPEYRDSGVEWLGLIPSGWDLTPLKHVADFINGDAFKPTEWASAGMPIIRIQNLNGSEDFNYYDGVVEARYLVHDGDLLFGWSGNRGTSFGPFLWRRAEVCALNQHIFRVVPYLMNERSLYWTLKAVTAHVEDQAHGIIGMVHVTKGDLGSIAVPVPPPPEQRQIAAFLDRETAKIDALVAEQEKLIVLLKEKRQAVISHAVTKGLDANVPMKDSGVEWLGEVPAHWEVVPLCMLATMIQTGPFGSQLHSADYVDNGTPVINPSNIQDGKLEPDWSCSITTDDVERLSQHKLIEGDIVFGRRGEMGRCALVSANEVGWICGTGSLNVRLSHRAFPPFVSIYLRTEYVRERLKLESVGSTMDNLNTQILGSISVPASSVEEQRAIASYLDIESTKFDTLTAEAQSAIDLLQERRTALISAAVTGKIDVRSLAPQF
jgi:type I restriction enzyme S subunit